MKNEEEYLEAPEDFGTEEEIPKTKEETQEEIFNRALDGGGTWKNKKGNKQTLSPFSYNRRRAAMAMDCRIFKLTEDEATALEATGYYSGIDTDAIIITWLCLQPTKDVLKAIRIPTLAFERALTWGEREEIEPGKPSFEAAVSFMALEFSDMQKAQGNFEEKDPQPTDKGEKKTKKKKAKK